MPRLTLILLLALLPFASGAQSAAPVAGTDYVVIDDGQPWQPLDGRIEVVEIFAYGCEHCADFQPRVEAWLSTLPDDVRFSYVPAAYSPRNPYARAFFAAQALGALDTTHAELFDAIHVAGTVPGSNASVEELTAFYSRQGVDAGQFKAAMADPDVAASVLRARDFMIASGLRGTPTLVVDGKYRVQGRTHRDTLRIADYLVEMQRAQTQRPGR